MTASKSLVLELAAVRHRISHDDLPDPRELTLAVVRQHVGGAGGTAGASSAVLGSLVGGVETSFSAKDEEKEPECPDPCGEVAVGSPDTFVGKEMLQVATAHGEKLECSKPFHSGGIIQTGAATVFVNNLAAARRTDKVACGALIGEGEVTVFVGGPTTDKSEPKADASSGAAAGQSIGAGVSPTAMAMEMGGQMAGGSPMTAPPAPTNGGAVAAVTHGASVAHGPPSPADGAVAGQNMR